MKNKEFLVVAYVTKNTPYEIEVKNLEASLRHFGLDYHILTIENQGSWQKNTMIKATLIREVLRSNEMMGDFRPIVCVDSDAVIERYPEQFHYIDADFAAYFKYGVELLSGTLFFQNNQKAFDLIDMWIKQNERNTHILEQKNLQAVVPRWEKDGGNLYRLDQKYCYIFDDVEIDPHQVGKPYDPVVIRHYQASRKFRETVRVAS